MLERAGVIEQLFDVIYKLLGALKGGLATATIIASTILAAMVGVIGAAEVTMGIIALPAMLKRKYNPELACGSILAGGTLGILIPPSVILVIYALLTEQSIAAMFLAAFVPGALAALGYILAIAVFVRLNPAAGPAAPKAGAAERRASVLEIWPVVAIFALVIGGIYLGWFTPTEGAAVGACATGLLAVVHGGMRLPGFAACLKETARTTAMIFLILLGAEFYNAFLALTRMPMDAAEAIGASGWPPILVLSSILLLYLVLGCVMDSLSMILLTVPIFFPIVMGLDFGLTPDETAIWFGILALIVVEVGLITPPVGLNVFIINAMAEDVDMLDTFKGVLPFLLSDVLRVLLLVAFPGITLWLVRVL
jgi:tripartite ATP-independent transporter DctM subunit